MSKYLIIAALLCMPLFGCAKHFAGPCYKAMQYRRDAENAAGNEKAALLGKADAEQRECDKQAEILKDRQKRDAMNRSR
jgi:hypothetical protein